jgi:hypothetical protein
MRKKLLFALTIALLATLVIAVPTLAFSSIEFNVYDAVTLQPWGTSTGQSYRIYIWGSSSGKLLDTGTLTTGSPSNPPSLHFTCDYNGYCPPSSPTFTSTTYFTAPVTSETVNIYIILTGTTGNPSTIIRSYQQPPIDLGTYVISQNSGTGPNVITLAGAKTESPNTWLPAALAAVALVGVGGVMLRRRRIA